MADDRWMTYADAAEAIGMTTEGLRQRARREGWRRQLGNDGKTLVLVTADTTARTPPGDRAETAPPEVDTSPGDRPDDRAAVSEAVWRELIAGLDARADELRADITREREERQRERDRADVMADRVAGLARELAQAVGQGASRERELLDRVSAAETALVEYRTRPWWRRIAG